MKRSSILKWGIVIAAITTAILCIYCCVTHSPNEETLYFTNDPDIQEGESSALSYYFCYTGERADAVSWDFGDGTSVEAFEVFKEFSEPGSYYILCKASNANGDRYSAYNLTIVGDSDFGFLDGYDKEISLAIASVALMLLSLVIWRK